MQKESPKCTRSQSQGTSMSLVIPSKACRWWVSALTAIIEKAFAHSDMIESLVSTGFKIWKV